MAIPLSSKKQQEKQEKERENREKIQRAISILMGIADNTMTPKQVRQSIKDIVNSLKDERLDAGVRAANAISMLDELTQSPNVPSHMRVTLWQAVSILESIRAV